MLIVLDVFQFLKEINKDLFRVLNNIDKIDYSLSASFLDLSKI